MPEHDAAHVDGVEAIDNLHPEPVAAKSDAGDANDSRAPGLIIMLIPLLIVAICFAQEAHLSPCRRACAR